MNGKIRIVQHNVNRQQVASLQLRDYCDLTKADIVLIQEPITKNGRTFAFENCRQAGFSDNPGAVIVVLAPCLKIIELKALSSHHVAAVKISESQTSNITIVSAYFKFNMPTPTFTEKIRAILERETRTIIGADVNGHSTLWHCPISNNRGGFVEEMIGDFDLSVVNKPTALYTYDREGMGRSNIDVTITTPVMETLISNWTVSDITDSDHNVLSYELSLQGIGTTSLKTHCFNVRKANWDKFVQSLLGRKGGIDCTSISTRASTIITALQKAAKDSMPSKSRYHRAGSQPWWTEELENKRKELARAKRLGTNRTDRIAYNAMRNSYLAEIRRAKANAWRSFSNDININKWGKAFKWAKNGHRKRSMPSTLRTENGDHTGTLDDTADLLLGTFFPRDNQINDYSPEGRETRDRKGEVGHLEDESDQSPRS